MRRSGESAAAETAHSSSASSERKLSMQHANALAVTKSLSSLRWRCVTVHRHAQKKNLREGQKKKRRTRLVQLEPNDAKNKKNKQKKKTYTKRAAFAKRSSGSTSGSIYL